MSEQFVADVFGYATQPESGFDAVIIGANDANLNRGRVRNPLPDDRCLSQRRKTRNLIHSRLNFSKDALHIGLVDIRVQFEPDLSGTFGRGRIDGLQPADR